MLIVEWELHLAYREHVEKRKCQGSTADGSVVCIKAAAKEKGVKGRGV